MLKSTLNRFNRILTPQTVAIIASFIVGLLVEQFARVPIVQSVTLILIIALCIMTVSVIGQLRQETVDTLAQMRLSAKVAFEKDSDDTDFLYREVMTSLRAARKSIRVVALHKPRELFGTPGRKKYFDELRELLKTKQAQDEQFRFERILQVKDLMPGTLKNDGIDQLTFEHCKHLNELEYGNNHLVVRLWQIPDILNPLTFFIIDDERLILLMPDVKNVPMLKENNVDYGLGTRPLGTCFTLSDPDGQVISEFLRLYEMLAHYADPIRRVIGDVQEL